MSTLQAATGQVALACDDSLIIAGSIQPRRTTGQQGELRATALVLRADVCLCIVACDVLCVTRDIADRAARAIEAACAIPFDHILISASHTHHAPSTFEVHGYGPEPGFCRQLEAAIVAAATQATACLDGQETSQNAIEAELGFARGQEATVGANSRILLADGTVTWCWGCHDPADLVRPTGPFDPDLALLALRRASGELAALLFNHSTHNIGPCGPGGRSPGFYGMAAQELEQALDTRVLFLPGAFGSTHNLHVRDLEAKTRIRGAVDSALGRLEWGLRGPVAAVRREFEFSVRHFDDAADDRAVARYCRGSFEPERAEATIEVFRAMRRKLAPQQGAVRRTWLQAIRLGEVVLVGVPGEMFAELGLAIRRRSPFRHTYVIGLANDEIGYIPDARAYDHGGYQLWTGLHSVLPRGAGEQMVDAALALVAELGAVGAPPSEGTAAEPTLRPLRGDEAPALQAFYNSLSPATRRLFRPIGWNATLPTCAAICEATAGSARHDLVLDAGGRLVGWAFLTRLDSASAHLGIGLAEPYVGRGLGRRLMEALIAHARDRGLQSIDLCHVTDNARAHRLYEALGFRTTATHTGSDGQPYVRMRLPLQH